MNIATKAALYSALLFPGWGQFYLKRYKRGLIFFMPVLAAALALVWSIIDIGISIIKATPFKKGTVHLANAIQVAVDALKAINLSYFILLLIVISVFWILSIIDAYQLGKKIMKAPTTDVNPKSTSPLA